MARTTILKKDGTPTRFFWSDKDGSKPSHKTVYKQTDDGIKRMKGVSYDVARNQMRKED
jgi:hypothetical protein